jgi:nucleoid DNA-binding protein
MEGQAMSRISIQEFAERLAERKGISVSDAQQFLTAMLDTINEGLKDDKTVKVKGLGTFKVIDVKQRKSVDVNTGEEIIIEGRGKITFTPDSIMKDLVNKPFSQFETVVLKDGVDFNEAENANQSEEAEKVVLDEIEDSSSAPLVEFVDEPQPEIINEPAKLVEPEIPEKPEVPQKSEVHENPEIPEKSQPSEKSEPSESSQKSELSAASESLEQTDSSEPEDVETSIGEEEGSSFKKYLEWIGIAVLTLAVGILIGYLMGNRSTTPQAPENPSVAAVDSGSVKALPVDSDSAIVDSLDEEEEILEDEDSEEEDEDLEDEDPQADNAPEATTEERPLDKWEAMDVRVKTGAYRILGTDTVIKAKAGDNLTRICNRTIGPGMECYLEVFNGIASGTALKAGQEIKIPKLELKKKKKK